MISRVFHLLANDKVYVFDEHDKPIEAYNGKKFQDVIVELMAARDVGTKFFIQHIDTRVSAELFQSRKLYDSVKQGG